MYLHQDNDGHYPVDDNFYLRLEYFNGTWGVFSFICGDVCVRIDTGFVLYDSLYGLIRIADNLLNGVPAKVIFGMEPGEAHIEANLLNDGNAQLKFTEKRDGYNRKKVNDAIIICPLERYAKQVIKMFASFRYEHREDEYMMGLMNQYYPNSRLDRLRQLLRARKEKTGQ